MEWTITLPSYGHSRNGIPPIISPLWSFHLLFFTQIFHLCADYNLNQYNVVEAVSGWRLVFEQIEVNVDSHLQDVLGRLSRALHQRTKVRMDQPFFYWKLLRISCMMDTMKPCMENVELSPFIFLAYNSQIQNFLDSLKGEQLLHQFL